MHRDDRVAIVNKCNSSRVYYSRKRVYVYTRFHNGFRTFSHKLRRVKRLPAIAHDG